MISAKKSLGQNFINDRNIIEKILNIVDIKNKKILEIGPGTGNLTSGLLNKLPKKLIAIEKDKKLVELLQKNYGTQIKLIEGDVLKIDENQLDNDKLTVFGNLPYNISTEILCKWILNLNDENFWFDCLILMFQKEVADRIISLPNTNNYGRLSIISNWKLMIKKICDVKPASFFPKPKIDSTVLYFQPKQDFFKFENPKNLEKITRIFFAHRRKMIKKPYNLLFNGNIDVANKLNINLKDRPQNLNFETFYKLTNEFEKLTS